MLRTCQTYHPRGELVDGYRVRQHPSYTAWSGMWSRCSDPDQPNYKNYGGRGVTICERWKHFKNFAEDMGIRPSKQHSLDRIDNSKGYSIENCRWATRIQQNTNKRTYITNKTGVSGIRVRNNKFNVRVTFEGKRKSIGNYDTIEEAIAAREKATRNSTV